MSINKDNIVTITSDLLDAVCDYIKTHLPKETEFDTINAAFMEVTGKRALTAKEVAGDDGYMIPEDEANLFKGVLLSPGSMECFRPSDITKIREAVKYAMENIDKINSLHDNKLLNESNELREMFDDSLNHCYVEYPDNENKDYDKGNDHYNVIK